MSAKQIPREWRVCWGTAETKGLESGGVQLKPREWRVW